MSKLSISGRIIVIVVLVAIASAAISGGMSLYVSKSRFSDYVSSTDQKMVEGLSRRVLDYYKKHGTLEGLQGNIEIPRPPIPPEEEFGPGHPRRFREGFRLRLVVTNLDGIVVADSRNRDLGKVWDVKSSTLDRYPLKTDDNKLIGYIYVGGRMEGRMKDLEEVFVRQTQIQTTASILIAALLALGLGVFLTRRIVTPITEISRGIHQLARGNFGVRVQPRGDKELYQLGHDFNIMAQRLQDNDNNRRTFMANIAHEIRTPLSILRGELEAIQSGRIQATEEVVSSLIDEIIRLTRLVKDFESLSMAESGGLRLNKEKLAVEDILEALLPLRLLMEQDEIDYQVHVDPQITEVYADRNRLLQILINLLTNAIKNVGPGGQISLNIERVPEGVLFAVRDNGPGIPEHELERVFERFFRSDDNDGQNWGGTGLGLAIARSYVEAHGGRIWAESKLNDHTVFYFVLPCD